MEVPGTDRLIIKIHRSQNTSPGSVICGEDKNLEDMEANDTVFGWSI